MKIIFKGGDGKDNLVGGPPADTLIDILGPDKFICGQRKDIVLDFNTTKGDIRSNYWESATTNNITGEQMVNGSANTTVIGATITKGINDNNNTNYNNTIN